MFRKARTFMVTGVLLCTVALGAAAIDGVKAGVVNAGGSLNLRSESNTSCEILKKLSDNTDVCIFGEANGFYQVSAGGTVGYVSAEYITVKDIMNVANGGGAKITASVLNMREKPSLEAEVVTKLPESAVTEIIGINNGWLKVRHQGTTGYISPDYVQYVTIGGQDNGVAPEAAPQGNAGQDVVNFGKKFLGTKYVYGGSSPSGFDCSGFTSYVYKQFGISLERTSRGQTSNGYKVEKNNLQAGDLVFFTSGGSTVGHVGIYIGDGSFIHAVKPGKALSIDTLNSGYYSSNYWGARRIL